MSEFPRLMLVAEPRAANCSVAAATEYTHETYRTARAVLELPAGRVEISQVSSPEEFATDREITQSEYDSIRECLRQMHDCAAMWSDPHGLVEK